MAKNSTATITFKSGASIEIETKSISATRNAVGELVRVKWETPDGAADQLVSLTMDNIDAIVFHDRS